VFHLRLIVPAAHADRTLELLRRDVAVSNVVHLPDAASKPRGDLVLCDVAREDASALLQDLREIGLEREGSIAVEAVDVSLSAGATAAERLAAGAAADAVVWEQVEALASEVSELSYSYLAFMTLATLIAGVGILTDSLILIIGAMVVGPEFGPLAGFCVAVAEHRRALALHSLRALIVGFSVAIAATTGGTVLLRAAAIAPHLPALTHTLFIAKPNGWSALVALLAGVAGTLALTTAKSGALIGVLISVTTVPAAANIGVALAYGHWHELAGAAAQLAINLAALMASGVVTLVVQRSAFAHRLSTRRTARPG
jgi:uncharacterized hydrophobic protein (TIGR00271 family)